MPRQTTVLSPAPGAFAPTRRSWCPLPITLVLLAAASGLPATASAQSPELPPGARVRVEAASIHGRLTGTVAGQTADALTVAMKKGAPVTVPLASITTLRVSRGHSHGEGLRRGLLWGTATGALLGAVPIVAACAGSSGDCDAFLATAIPAGAATGALLGMAIGAAIGAERWDRVPLARQVSLGLARGGGVRLMVHVPGAAW